MKKSIKNTLVFALILALFSSCSRFEDGPKISFRSIEKRIYGTYRVEYFSKNGTDLTDYWNQYYDLTFMFYRSNDGEHNNYTVTKGCIDSLGCWKSYTSGYRLLGLTIDGNVEISMKNSVYDTTNYPGRILYPLIVYGYDSLSTPRFTLMRLTNTEIWMEHTYGNDIYEVHLKELPN